jgi:hypothetical protein
MRGITVDHARERQAAKRGGSSARVPFDEALSVPVAEDVDLIALEAALETGVV